MNAAGAVTAHVLPSPELSTRARAIANDASATVRRIEAWSKQEGNEAFTPVESTVIEGVNSMRAAIDAARKASKHLDADKFDPAMTWARPSRYLGDAVSSALQGVRMVGAFAPAMDSEFAPSPASEIRDQLERAIIGLSSSSGELANMATGVFSDHEPAQQQADQAVGRTLDHIERSMQTFSNTIEFLIGQTGFGPLPAPEAAGE